MFASACPGFEPLAVIVRALGAGADVELGQCAERCRMAEEKVLQQRNESVRERPNIFRDPYDEELAQL